MTAQHAPPGKGEGESAVGGRRDGIIRSAVNTFSHYGFQASTIKRLARDAKISEALVYKYFASKEELFDAVLNHLVETARPILPRAGEASQLSSLNDLEFLTRLALRSRAHFRDHPEHLRLLYFAGLQGHSLASKYFERQVKHYYEAIIGRIEAGQRAGIYRDLPAVTGARAFLGMVSHHVLIQVLFKDPFLPANDDDWAATFADIFLKGICK